MSAPMKARRISQEIPIRVGNRRPRLFLVPKSRAADVMKSLRDFEVEPTGDDETIPWRIAAQNDIDQYTEPGVVLRGARIKENMTQIELAEKLGIPSSNISEMESGKRPISKKMAQRLAKVLKIHYKVFL
jgi:ribosome-binding protein aMBF1 (putative translation factor)